MTKVKSKNISFYGSHNAAYVVEINGNIEIVLEVERFLNYKNSGMAQYLTPNADNILFYAEYLANYIHEKFNIDEFDNCFYSNTDVNMDNITYHLEKFIKAKNYVPALHHESHAAGTFYQSPHKKALVFSFDGGGNDGKFNVYLADRKSGLTLLENVLNPMLNHPHIGYDLGFPYMVFGHFLSDIKQEVDLGSGNLVYPGKLMGLASYGNIRNEWLPFFIEFYKNNPDGRNYKDILKLLEDATGLIFDPNNRITGQDAYDVAATSQRAFEDCFLEIAIPHFENYPDLPICITGGCGLNIILNTRLVTEFNKDVFVAPNPNDCGLATGMMLNHIKPEQPIDLTYSGLPLIDFDSVANLSQNQSIFSYGHKLDMNHLLVDLLNGKIIGVARGNSEHGPRALGNRSILCNPSIPDMKDILNAKVKNREWYRPFAPVVRLEDVNKYFEWNRESRWMSFCPAVREEWREKLAAVTHVDGTARLQTVTREQNKWLYELLTEFEKLSGVGVLLNTSFNVNGKPILSTVSDAFKLFTSSELDGLVLENLYFSKHKILKDTV